jgi:tetratricopeptide (TPR) repeat protein
MAFNKAKAMQEAEKYISQGKISQAIKQYNHILEKDPSDISLLNNIGDLYYRDKNIPLALQYFHKLADAFMKDGFTLKAIAIYRKITKIDPNTVDPFIKLAELYLLQGLSREAREQYAHAADFYNKKKQTEKALELLGKIVALDPENRTYRVRMAEYCQQLGRKEEASKIYVELAEVALRSGDLATAEPALKKAEELDPTNSQVHLLRARMALSKHEFGQVEKIIDAVPGLKDSAPGRQVLLETYLAADKLGLAEKLVLDVFRANPADFSPLASFSSACLEKGQVDAALKPLAGVADEVIERKDVGALTDSLRQIWTKSPQHIATLELLTHVCEATADDYTLPEVLESLGEAYLQAGNLQKAETTIRKLVARQPGNEHFRGLLNQALEQQGKPVEALRKEELAGVEMSLPEVEAAAEGAPAAPGVDTEQEAVVKEALENSDLFARYGLVDKAVAELEKVLATYPDQIDIHRRILEVCHRSQPERASQAAETLSRIFSDRGDSPTAEKYDELVRELVSGIPEGELRLPPVAVQGEPTPAEAPAEVELAQVFPTGGPEAVAERGPREVPLDLSAAISPPTPVPAAEEMDLSTDMAALTAGAGAPPVGEEAAVFDYEETRAEVDFYAGRGLLGEARKVIETLEEKFPGNPQVSQLRQHLEAQEVAPAARAVEAAPAEEELPAEFPAPAPAEAAPEEAPLEMPAAAISAAAPPSAEAPAAGADMLGSLVGDLAASLEGFGEPAPPPSAHAPGEMPPAPAFEEGASPLSGLLDELGEGAEAPAAQDDPETHYNLGVAFREMSLLDEAIGEFQKVLKGAQKGKYPPNFLQACSLLAVCFMDKGMPAIAAKWYLRALETPELDEESTLALQYDLGVAYEQAGDARKALEKFSEVYSQNIDYRDVAEKIRSLHQKAP